MWRTARQYASHVLSILTVKSTGVASRARKLYTENAVVFHQIMTAAIASADLERRLKEELHTTYVYVEDESHLHAGHAGNTGGSHFRVIVVSPDFAGKVMLKQHRMVYDALADQMKSSIHALALKTYTPEQWEAEAYQS
ncbi:MAG: BolA family protein [Cyanobacteria bacterium P01_F01_bin.33]